MGIRITLASELVPQAHILIHSKGRGRFSDKNEEYIVIGHPQEFNGVWTVAVAPIADPTAVETLFLEKYGIEITKQNNLYWIEIMTPTETEKQ